MLLTSSTSLLEKVRVKNKRPGNLTSHCATFGECRKLFEWIADFVCFPNSAVVSIHRTVQIVVEACVRPEHTPRPFSPGLHPLNEQETAVRTNVESKFEFPEIMWKQFLHKL
ncbi:hypothetical protein TNCV_1390681 [Trichonephila clavipes]|nr:hypothetical protein TNCV_1390681 [Trichonephila clavipes]